MPAPPNHRILKLNDLADTWAKIYRDTKSYDARDNARKFRTDALKAELRALRRDRRQARAA